MINILILFDEQARWKQTEQLLKSGAVSCSTTAVPIAAWRESTNQDDIRNADVVIALCGRAQGEGLAELERLMELVPNAVAMMLCDLPTTEADLLAAMRIGVRYVHSWPIDEPTFWEELRRMENKRRSQGGMDGRVLTFLSGQGGSGTTFVATQFGDVCAHRLGKKVLVIDADRQYADAQLFLSAEFASTTLADLASQADGLDAALFEASLTHVAPNIDLLPGGGDPVQSAQVQAEQLSRILKFARQRYDVVIVDAGHHIDSSVMEVLDHSDALFVIVRQGMPDLHAGKRLFDILFNLGYPDQKMQLIVNQLDKTAKVSIDVLRDTLSAKALHWLPDDSEAARKVSDNGEPLSRTAPNSRIARAIESLAMEYWKIPAPGGNSWWTRMLSRVSV